MATESQGLAPFSDWRSDDLWQPFVPVGPGAPYGEKGRRILVRWDLELGPDDRDMVIQLVRPAMLSAGSEADARTTVRRFEHEAQATAALTSPHTIRLFDFGVADEGSFYYVMELLDGRDMA